jgi:hypothetical protein
MRRIPGVVACALAATALSLFPIAAHADPAGPPEGRACSFTTVTGSGQINGGPLRAPGHAVSIRCSIHVGNGTHSGAAAVSEQAGPAAHAVVLPPTPITLDAPEEEAIHVCTESTVDATTWYLSPAGWTTHSGAACPAITTCDLFHNCGATLLPPELTPLGRVVDCVLSPETEDCLHLLWLAVDEAICPLLPEIGPGFPVMVEVRPDGVVHILGEWIWDCPPYQVWPHRM